jgi:hypothetical protein
VTRWAWTPLLACAAPVLACGQRHAPVSSELPLTGDIARVGDTRLPASLVVSVALAKHMPARAALEELVEDALLGQAGAAQAANAAQPASWEFAGALARGAVARIVEGARQAGPPTANELSTVTVVHAVVLNSVAIPRESAQAIATSIRDAVEHATTAEDFERRAESVPRAAVRLTVERIAAFGADGQLPDGTRLDPSFVAAAFELPAPADTSPIVETPFGLHVLRLLERVLPEPSSLEQRQHDLADVVVAMRARSRLDRLLAARRGRTKIDIATAAVALMARGAARTP